MEGGNDGFNHLDPTPSTGQSVPASGDSLRYPNSYCMYAAGCAANMPDLERLWQQESPTTKSIGGSIATACLSEAGRRMVLV